MAVLAVIAVAAFVYMLGNAISSQGAKNWARTQVYEAFVSIILLAAFAAFTYVFFINPVGAFNSVNIVPTACVSGANGLPAATNLFMLSTCDLAVFNSAGFNIANTLYQLSYVMSLVPGLYIGLSLPPQKSYLSLGLLFSIPSILPFGIDTALSMVYNILLFMMVLNQLQLMLLSSSLLMLSVFLTIGLVARTFGFSRSFGGAMIAFGLGLGIIFPLVVSLTYGFIDVNAGMSSFMSCGYTCLASNTAFAISLVADILSALALSSPASSDLAKIAFLIGGLTFIPFLNFTIVDAFIVDFSQAIGERMSFITLLANFV